MRRIARTLLLLAWAVHSLAIRAQGFTIEDFKTDLWLRKDGSFLVEETILVNFTESKHGIFREIPFRYATNEVGAERALGRTAGLPYITYLDSIDVPGNPFTMTVEGDFKNLRIGSADEYVSGKKEYKIRYKVYGAINRFDLHDELYWNVNGLGWQVSADRISIDIHLPDPKFLLKDTDGRVFTGALGAMDKDYVATLMPGYVRASTTRRMEAHEGMTIVIRLPKTMLKHAPPPLSAIAQGNYIDSLHSEVELRTDGSMHVNEWIAFRVLDKESKLFRYFPQMALQTMDAAKTGNASLRTSVLFLRAKHPNPAGYSNRVFGIVDNNSFPSISLGDATGTDSDIYVVELEYDLWNCSAPLAEGQHYRIPWIGDLINSQPVRAGSIHILPPPKGRIPAEMSGFDGGVLESVPAANGLAFRLRGPAYPGTSAVIAMDMGGAKVTPVPAPVRLHGDGDFFERVHMDVKVGANGKITFSEYILANALNHPYDVLRQVNTFLPSWTEPAYLVRRPTLFGHEAEFLSSTRKCSREFYDEYWATPPGMRIMLPISINERDTITVRTRYWIYGAIRKSGDTCILNLPLISSLTAPAEEVTFSIQLEGNPVLSPSDYAFTFSGTTPAPIPLNVHATYQDGVIEGRVVPGLTQDQTLNMYLRLPASGGWSSLSFEALLFLKHQVTLTICLLAILALALLWFFKGRDKRFTKVVEFYPPDDLTSAEAGLLYDGDLQNRDILSLIYQWGAKGILRIEEVEGKENQYRLVKLKGLPNTARKYERTLFNGLFEKGDSIMVSSLAEKFHSTMAAVRIEIEEYATKRNYFMPGTRGFGNFLILLSMVFGGIGLLIFIGSILTALSGLSYWGDVVLGLGLLAGACLGFGTIMDRRAPIGQKQYEKLMGFREFLEKAESDRLRLLLDEDPGYFGLTLSYAIGLGLANKWVEKFGALLQGPPSYYRPSSSSTDFNAMDFNRRMSSQLTSMAVNFTSQPPAPKSSGSSWSSSSGSSYSSSSSSSSYGSSGGSGFSSGGGSSGGGYGGGGGGSW